ncbi:putative serine/threonine-protein kinase STE20-like [Homalodisca vitripennis]|uniref:putative serine/threonine-protein kinase STE20-like n=1 Tax=Homalodisca vitripennis TaxID=197043 RepID=UPI001EEC7479|nr:putative serine/threonine-protein kinase STE20-like [Homalodisca vitripennis]
MESTIDFKLGAVIGKGSYGKVHVGKYKNNQEDVAIKTCCIDEVPSDEWQLTLGETCITMELCHEGLIKFIHTQISNSVLYRVMPLMPYLSCDKIMEKSYPYGIPEVAISMILKDILNALEYLHGRNYINRSVKGSHILISESGAAVLTSFRFMLKMNVTDPKTYSVENIEFMKKNMIWLSPEIIKQDSTGYSYTSDIYSVGITACELANGVAPYKDTNPTMMLVKKLKDRRPQVWDSKYLEQNQACSSQQALPRQPAPVCGQGVNSILLSESSSDSDEDFTVKNNSMEQMNKIYREKLFSKEFQNFLDLSLCIDGDARLSASGALKHRFIKSCQGHPSTELLQLLNLTDPVVYQPVPETQEAEKPQVFKLSPEDIDWNFDSTSSDESE